MLVLTRKAGERIVIGDNIVVVVNRIAGNRVTIGIEAPSQTHIVRGELKRIVDDFREPSAEEREAPVSVPFPAVGTDPKAESFTPPFTPRVAR